MGMRFARRINWPAWVQTIGAMQKEMAANADRQVKGICSKCLIAQKVDIGLLVKAYGPDFSLIDHTGACRVDECDGHVRFLYSNAPGTPFRPLKSA